MESDNLRIGDRERDEAISYLREHLSTGRLDSLEFDDRMSKALEARTRTDLLALFNDLPSPKPMPAGPSPVQPQAGSPSYPTPTPYSAPSPYQPEGPYPAQYGNNPYGTSPYDAANPYGAQDSYDAANPYGPAPYAPSPYDTGAYQPVPYAGTGDEPRATPPQTPWYAQWWMLLAAIGVSAVTGARLGLLIPLMALWIWVIYPQIAKNQTRQPVAPPRPVRALGYLEREEVLKELRAGRKIHAIKRYREFTNADLRSAKDAVERMSRQVGF